MNAIPNKVAVLAAIALLALSACSSSGSSNNPNNRGNIDTGDVVIVDSLFMLSGGAGKITAYGLLSVSTIDQPAAVDTADTDPIAIHYSPHTNLVYVSHPVGNRVYYYQTDLQPYTGAPGETEHIYAESGDNPVAMAVSSDGGILYIACDSGQLTAVDAVNGNGLEVVDTGTGPVDIAWYDFRDRVILLCRDSNRLEMYEDDTLQLISAANLNEYGVVTPSAMALDGERDRVLITDEDSDNIIAISADDMQFLFLTPTGDRPIDIDCDIFANRTAVVCSGDNTLWTYANGPAGLGAYAPHTVGNGPVGVVINQYDERIYVLNSVANTISVFTTTGSIDEIGGSPFPCEDNGLHIVMGK
jgi:DNA-binding beta-propeller fold protein YncE